MGESFTMNCEHTSNGHRDPENLVEILCRFNKCKTHELAHVLRRKKVENIKYLNDKQVITLHLRHNRFVSPDNFNFIGSNRLFAYRGFLGVTVEQHLFSRHAEDKRDYV